LVAPYGTSCQLAEEIVMGGNSGSRRKRARRPVVSRPVRDVGVGFPELIAEVAAVIGRHEARQHQGPVTSAEIVEGFRTAKRFLEEFKAKYTPLPASAQPLFEAPIESLEHIESMLEGRTPPPTEKERGLHPFVRILIENNLRHAAQAGDLDAALDELRSLAALKEPPKRRRGRPSILTLEEIVEAKRLRDSGRSYGEIAKTLNHPSARISSALKHHYPPKKSR
jgi:hypothetical protein